jgi:hypothetical protein
MYRVMAAGETAAFEAHERIVLRVGDPAALAYSINGRRGRPLGPAETPVTVALTPENYRQFLQ